MSQSATPALPVDLYRQIVTALYDSQVGRWHNTPDKRRILRSLFFVSRGFNYEACRITYRTVSIHARLFDPLIHLFATSPRISQHVRSLLLFINYIWDITTDEYREEYTNLLQAALSSMVNLQKLCFNSTPDRSRHESHHKLKFSRLVEGTSFQLYSAQISLIDGIDNGVFRFLASQIQLVDLEIYSDMPIQKHDQPVSGLVSREDFLPNLELLRCTYQVATSVFRHPRPKIHRLSVVLDPDGRFGSSAFDLSTMDVPHLVVCANWIPPAISGLDFPQNLVSLRMEAYRITPQVSLQQNLLRLHRLRSLFLYYTRTDDGDGMKEFVRGLLDRLPNLREVLLQESGKRVIRYGRRNGHLSIESASEALQLLLEDWDTYIGVTISD